jgi:hypothetical protein
MMLRSIIRALTVAGVLAYATVGGGTPAFAHLHRDVGPFDTTVGWLEEPAFAGFRNAVQFIIARAGEEAGGHGHESGEEEHSGTPVTGATLKVQVIFGERSGTEKSELLEMTPAFGTPGEYRAFIVPTLPGTYTFHVTGTVGKRKIDQYYTSGEKGEEPNGSEFHDVRTPADVQFPTKPPSNADLSDKLDASTKRLTAAAASADDSAGTATTLGVVGIILGALGLVTGLVALRRRARA